MQIEEWEDIPGYEGLYQASTYGRIRTKEGKTTTTSFHGDRVWKQRVLKPKHRKRHKKNLKTDSLVDLWKDGKHKTFKVSKLVALTFCKGYLPGMTVNHKDGNTENNNVCNLEWLTNKDNIRHAFETGICTHQKHCELVDKDGNKKWFRSQSEASRFLGRSPNYVSYCKLNNATIRSLDGEVYGLV